MFRVKPLPPRSASDVALSNGPVQEARKLGNEVFQDDQPDVADAFREHWLYENQGAMDAWNKHVAEYGLPLAAYCEF